MYILSIEDTLSSAHQLREYKGKCENLHGHNWRIVVEVAGDRLNSIGLLVDFHDLKRVLGDILGELDHKNLNDVPCFSEHNPSSENLAAYIAGRFGEGLAGLPEAADGNLRVHSVTVWESSTASCRYEE